jgi:ribosomal protein S18 acetylase RimI-like enzyme
VAIGRVIGDGGWYFHIIDMAVLPQHLRRGLGDAVLSYLLERIRERALRDAYVSCLADSPGRHLYARYGFTESAPDSIGMVLKLG